MVSELKEEVSEKEASKNYEKGMNDHLNFPCVVQVVTDIGRAYNLTRRQTFDVIAVQQKIARPYGMTDLENCIFAADGIHMPFICLLGYREEKHLIRSRDMKCTFIRNAENNELSFEDFGKAIRSALFGMASVEVQLPPRTAQVHNTTAQAVAPVRAPKRALPHTNDAQISSPHSCQRPPVVYGHFPPAYPVPWMGHPSLDTRAPPHQASNPTTSAQEISSWEEMQYRANMMRYHQFHQHEQGHPYRMSVPLQVGYGPQPPAPHHHPHLQHQGIHAVHSASGQTRNLPPETQREQPRAHAASAVPPCPTSPAKRRRTTQPSTPTITCGELRQAPATVSPQKASVESVRARRARTPEHHPPAHNNHHVVHVRSLSEDSADMPEHEYVQSTRRSNAQSPGQVIDPELLDSFLDEDH